MPRKLQTTSDPWVLTDSVNQPNKLSLICLHHAGGDVSVFKPWLEFLPSWLQLVCVSLPGRGVLFAEKPYTHIDALIPELASRLQPWMHNNQRLIWA